jgi:hypothetical protein
MGEGLAAREALALAEGPILAENHPRDSSSLTLIDVIGLPIARDPQMREGGLIGLPLASC